MDRGTVRIKSLVQQQNAMSLAKAQAQTTQSGVKCNDYECTTNILCAHIAVVCALQNSSARIFGGCCQVFVILFLHPIGQKSIDRDVANIQGKPNNYMGKTEFHMG